MILVVDPEEILHARVQDRLDSRFTMESAVDVDMAAKMLDDSRDIDIVFLGPGLDIERVVGFTTAIRDEHPEISVVVVSALMSSELLQRLLRAGVRDVLPAMFSPKQLAASLEHAEASSIRERDRFTTERATGGGRGTIVTVLSAKGGVGKSFIASNLAVLLASQSEPVALVDLDVEFGDLGVFFQIQPKHTIDEAASFSGGLDGVALEGMLTQHESHVRLLAAPQEPGHADEITGDHVKSILELLAERYRYVIVDTPSSFTDLVLSAIDVSDVLPVVTAMDVASIRSAGLCLRTLEMLGVSATKVRLVLNRADSRVGLNLAEVERGLGTKVSVSIPSSREVPLSVNRGQPLAMADPRSAVTRAVNQLVKALKEPAPDQAGGRRSMLGRSR